MYLYKISILKQDKLNNDNNMNDLIGKMLHNWRTHYKNETMYKATLSKLILLCLLESDTYILCTITELNEMLKYYTRNLKFSQKLPEIIRKIGYTSLFEVSKLCKLLKFNNSYIINVSYNLTINNEDNYILSFLRDQKEELSFLIKARTLNEHMIAIKASTLLSKLNKLIFNVLLTQTRDNDINNDGACYASRNKNGTILMHNPITAEMCMAMGYNFYIDKSINYIWAVNYERSDGKFNIIKVEGDNANIKHLSDKSFEKLKNVILIKPIFKLAG